MSDKDLGDALLNLDLTPRVNPTASEVDRLIEADRRRVKWLTRCWAESFRPLGAKQEVKTSQICISFSLPQLRLSFSLASWLWSTSWVTSSSPSSAECA